MRIAFIGQKGIPAKSGGVEKHVEGLAARLVKSGHEVFAYVRNNYTDKNIKEYKGVKIIHLPSISTKNLDAISHTLLATVHALFQKYDIIHYHSIGPSSLIFLPKIFKRKTALVATYHCQDYYHKKWGALARAYLKFGEYIIATVPDRTIVVSKILGNYIRDKFKKRAAVIPNGVAVSPDKNFEYLKKWNLQKGGYILSVSRLIEHKGIHHLIKAFKQLEDKHMTREKKLVITGDGFYTNDYVKELKDLSRGRENIIFTGDLAGDALSQLFSHAYLFVQPSESEGLSIALLEAMGYGKAVLSSDIKENREPLGDKAALFFRSSDWRDLEEKLIYLINNPAAVKQMGENGMAKAKKEYDWDSIVNQTEDLYKNILLRK